MEVKKEEFEPDEKVKKHATTYVETIVHFVKAGLGSGIFAMAEAYSNVGLILAPIITAFLSYVCLYEQHVLLRSAANVREFYGIERIPDYGETFQLALLANDRWKMHARKMKIVSNIFLILTQLGFCAVYFVFIGSTMQHFLQFYGIEFGVRAIISMSLIPIGLSSLITNLKFLAPCSGIAGVCMIVGISITFYYLSLDLPPITDRALSIATFASISLFFGTVIYVFEGIGIVLPLQSEMKHPNNFSRKLGVLNIGVLILTSFVITFGFFGYWQYGPDVASSLTLNLPQDEILAQSVNIIIVVGVALGYALQFYIPIQILFPLVRRSLTCASNNPMISELAFRIFMVLVTFTVAILVPNVGLLISLIGAVCSNSLALVFPVIIEYLVMTRGDNKMSWFHSIKNILILTLATVGFLSGGYQSILGIIDLYT